MTDQIDYATAMQLFDMEVQIQYQNNIKLENTIDERHGTTGTTLNVPVSDLIEMEQGNFAPTDIPVTPVEETNVPITTKDYRIKTVIGGGERTLFNYDKIAIHAKLHAKATARMVDYVKINAIYSHPSVGNIVTILKTIGVNTGINADKMAAGLSYLEDQGVDVTNYMVSMWAPAILKKSLYGDDKVVNFFYNDTKPLTTNRIQTYLDVDCRFLGSNGINRIPFTGSPTNTYLVPMVHRDAIVQTFNREMQTSATWLPNQDRWELLSTLTTGANIIQLNGIVFLTADNPYAANP